MNYMLHYGVKGMKWGVRHDPERVGRAGPTASNISKTISNIANTESQDYRRYRQQGISAKEAHRMASVNKYVKGALLAAGGIAVGAAVLKATRMRGIKYADKIIKAGTTMQNINTHNPKVVGERVYATINKSDKSAYKGMYGTMLKFQNKGADVYNTTLKTTQNMKIASEKNATRVVRELVRNNPSYAKTLRAEIKTFDGTTIAPKARRVMAKAERDLQRGKVTTSVYRAQNIIMTGTKSSAKSSSEFQKALQKKGYSGLYDIHDIKYSPMKAKEPLILFNTNSAVKVAGGSKISGGEMTARLGASTVTKYAGTAIGGTAAGVGIQEARNRKVVRR